jgi:ferredoxin--NADP+ reductase
VPPTDDNIPGLTPRLALKRPGDRIYMGPKVAGRYTLGPVTDPHGTVVFFATGTGEAPHNAMVVELLRKGHMGRIVSAVTVRNLSDLGYLEKNRELERRYENFHYLPLPTREPGIPKRYIQDLINEDAFAKEFGVELDPERTHVFMCGNPAMIGLPKEDEETGALTYPQPTGVVEILTKRGFALDHRKTKGNLHYEEYW